MLTVLRRRWWLVVLSTGLSALASWLVVRDDPTVYERTATLLIRPAPGLDDDGYSDALSALQRETSLGIDPTFLSIVGSDEFLATAANDAGIRRSIGYSIRPTIRPSSDVIDLRLRGPDPPALLELDQAAVRLARVWLTDHFNGAFSLEALGSSAGDGPVLPDAVRSVRLGAVLGALLGLAIAAAEAWLSTRGRHCARADPKPSA